MTTLRIDGSLKTVFNYHFVVPTDSGETSVFMFDAWASVFDFNAKFWAKDAESFICSEKLWTGSGKPGNHPDISENSEPLYQYVESQIVKMIKLAAVNAKLSNSVKL